MLVLDHGQPVQMRAQLRRQFLRAVCCSRLFLLLLLPVTLGGPVAILLLPRVDRPDALQRMLGACFTCCQLGQKSDRIVGCAGQAHVHHAVLVLVQLHADDRPVRVRYAPVDRVQLRVGDACVEALQRLDVIAHPRVVQGGTLRAVRQGRHVPLHVGRQIQLVADATAAHQDNDLVDKTLPNALHVGAGGAAGQTAV
uniref:Uncharacterized protein n=1 Tax=Anopheles melas TaxID=34690 RepID=A0A182U1R2_9DIPT